MTDEEEEEYPGLSKFGGDAAAEEDYEVIGGELTDDLFE